MRVASGHIADTFGLLGAAIHSRTSSPLTSLSRIPARRSAQGPTAPRHGCRQNCLRPWRTGIHYRPGRVRPHPGRADLLRVFADGTDDDALANPSRRRNTRRRRLRCCSTANRMRTLRRRQDRRALPGRLHRRPAPSSHWRRRVRSRAGLDAGIPRRDRRPSAASCNPRPGPDRSGRRDESTYRLTDGEIPRFARGNVIIEVERRRLTTLFAGNDGLSHRARAGLTILSQPQSRPHDVAGRAVTARFKLLLDERVAMLVEAERRVLPMRRGIPIIGIAGRAGSSVYHRWAAATIRNAQRRAGLGTPSVQIQTTRVGTSTTRQPSGSWKVCAPAPAQNGFSASTGSCPAAVSRSTTACICVSL